MDRKIGEIGAIMTLVGVSILAITLHSRAHPVQLDPPRIQVVPDARQVLAVWNRHGVRGRTLIHFDRHLRADPEDTREPLFTAEEFGAGTSIEALCAAIRSDGLAPPRSLEGCSLERLNDLLKMPDLYRFWSRKKGDRMPGEAQKALRILKGYVVLDPAAGQAKIIRLNRLLLETAYPATCPKNTLTRVSDDNYVYLAQEADLITQVFHVVPDAAWPDVERVLRGYPLIMYADGVFRMVMSERDWVPISILRKNDLPRMRERVLVNINTEHWSDQELSAIVALLSSRTINSDLVTISGRTAGKSMSGFGAGDEHVQ